MRSRKFGMAVGSLALAAAFAHAWAADGRGGSCTSCTGQGPGFEPRCKPSWDEAKTKQPVYSMKCEYACARGRDSWHAPDAECRCTPPCGKVYVKKRLYKAEEDKVERVPKYEVETVPAQPCGCTGCAAGRKAWDPLGVMSLFHAR
jgi:hypothetical protein